MTAQWQVSTNGGTRSPTSRVPTVVSAGAATANADVPFTNPAATLADGGHQFRVNVTRTPDDGSPLTAVQSNAVVLTVTAAPVLSTGPVDVNVTAAGTGTMTAVADGPAGIGATARVGDRHVGGRAVDRGRAGVRVDHRARPRHQHVDHRGRRRRRDQRARHVHVHAGRHDVAEHGAEHAGRRPSRRGRGEPVGAAADGDDRAGADDGSDRDDGRPDGSTTVGDDRHDDRHDARDDSRRHDDDRRRDAGRGDDLELHRAVSRRRGLSRSGVVLGALALAALTGCSGDDEPTRDASGAVTKSGSVSVFDLKPADCLDPPADVSGEIATIKVVPCTDPHTQEVFAKVEATEEAYPGAEALAVSANKLCVTEMQGDPLYLSADAGYFWSYLLPSFNGWNNDKDRTIVCVFVFPDQGSVTGSVVEQVRAGTVQPGDPPPVSAVPPALADGG